MTWAPPLPYNSHPWCRYPILMADRSLVSWAAGADPGSVMEQHHDRELLEVELLWGGAHMTHIAIWHRLCLYM